MSRPLIEIDRNGGAGSDEGLTNYLNTRLAHLALSGHRQADVIMLRVSTDPSRDRREWLAHQPHEAGEITVAGCYWCEAFMEDTEDADDL